MMRLVLTALTLGLLSFKSLNSNAVESASAMEINHAAAFANGSNLTFAEKEQAFDTHVQEVYNQMGLKQKGLSIDVFRNAYVGFQNFRSQHLTKDKAILTIVDFTKNSREKRLWVVDLKARKLLFNTLVAHGRNTGNLTAESFSNEPNSNMSSLGFYLTDATYYGKHGLSLRLSGMDEKYNSNARARAIVVHGAEYATQAFINQYGRLGRSLGCPALPQEVSKDVIETIKNKTVLYIHGKEKNYTSDYLDQKAAIESFAATDLESLITV